MTVRRNCRRGAGSWRAHHDRVFNTDATAETLVDERLRTGDVAMMDVKVMSHMGDRIKDMIISGGENVYPAEIEGVLMSHESIAEAAVIAEERKHGESPRHDHKNRRLPAPQKF